MPDRKITITFEVPSVDPIREDLIRILEDYLMLREDGRSPIEAEVIAMMLERAIKAASRVLINNDMHKLHGNEMVEISPRERSAKWFLESQKIPLPKIWVDPDSIVSVEWEDKT